MGVGGAVVRLAVGGAAVGRFKIGVMAGGWANPGGGVAVGAAACAGGGVGAGAQAVAPKISRIMSRIGWA
jgi:hypothetical protein